MLSILAVEKPIVTLRIWAYDVGFDQRPTSLPVDVLEVKLR
jgi:hypothetical protein